MKEHAEILMKDEKTQWTAIIVAVFTVILTIVLLALWQRRRSSGRSVLITGMCDSGKTLLYARLVYSRFIETYTSAKVNIADIEVKKRLLQIVDIPGHIGLKYHYLEKYKSSARAIIYVIDSVTICQNIRDVAEYLYLILSDGEELNIPVLILCNKQDQTTAKGCSIIKKYLERELTLMRITILKQPQHINAGLNPVYLGKSDKDFEFEDLSIPVEFAECSAFDKDSESSADIEQVKSWFEKIA